MAKQETILIADDADINRAILRNLFEEDYNLLEAENGEHALLLLRQYRDSIAVVLLDLLMPLKDGYEVLDEMRQERILYHAPVVVITAEDSTDNRVKVFEMGASDIIAKPFEPEVVKSRVNNIIELGRYRRNLETLVEEKSAQVRESNAAVIDMLSSVIEYRSLETGQHIQRIRMFTKILLEDVARNYQEYNLTPHKIRLITESSSMHDIGKIAISDSLLNKPGRLTREEFEVMKTHTLKGCEILSGLDRLQDQEYLQYAYQICRYHHERWDGTGYPDGLKGNSIPICAQVVAIADCFDALTADRVYKKAIPSNKAFSMILNGECGAFSPRLLECFKNVRIPFLQLAEEYTDGLAETSRRTEPVAEVPVWDNGENMLEQSQLRYFALLRHLNSTVMEVDLHTGFYYLVYQQDQDFSALRSGNSFEESIRNFADTSVHPEDRNEVLGLPEHYIQDFFNEGETCREWRYRILDQGTGAYVWCRFTLLRINLENPRLRRVLLIWHKEGDDTAWDSFYYRTTAADPLTDQLLGGIQKSRCDQYFTIIQASRSLVDLLGYSKEEILDCFQNRLLSLICPADREKVVRQFREQREAGNLMDLEYRLVAKDGHIVWISSRNMIVKENGTEVMYGILLDVTQPRQAEEKLRLSLERHNIIMSQTNDIIFEWDMVRDELYLSPNWEQQYGYTPVKTNVRETLSKALHFHPDDVEGLISLMEAMIAGVAYKEAELRLIDSEGVYRWRQVRSTAQFDLDGKPFKAVGVIVDIDDQKRTTAELENQVSRDALTGLYNKRAAQSRVEAYLAECGRGDLSALMVLDIDDFKCINDRCGHMFGDAVLVELSAKLSALFGETAVIGRIGGDEFLIYVPNVRSEPAADRRAGEIIGVGRDVSGEHLNGLAFSCSIGLACQTGESMTFQELFKRADRALYRAKASGKNRCVRYCEGMEDSLSSETLEQLSDRRTKIESNQSDQWNLPHLVLRSFDILYSIKDFSRAVETILALIGGMFGVSRVYIFESCNEGKDCSNTFEWCTGGISPQAEALQNLPYRRAGQDYRDYFGEDGLFYCQNIPRLNKKDSLDMENRGVLSTLQFAIREKGVFHGFVGFDDCKVRRLWTKEQINALVFIGQLMSVFLLKNRVQEALSMSVENLESALVHQEACLVACRDISAYKTAGLSCPAGPDRTDEEFFPASTLDRGELERQLGNKAIDILGKSIPGGMMGGYLEPDFPLYYVNDDMLAYLGYTYREFVEAIDGRVINCMHPDDRERVERAVEEAFSQELDYEVKYRMGKKDGSYIWVNDIGRKGRSVDGRNICISVIRDITAEVEAREQLKQQAREQERQAQQYDRLFQSMLCGIVHYRLTGRHVVFKRANREAIRIFGYEPEAFWAKKDWDLAALVADEDRDRVLGKSAGLLRPGDKSNYEYRFQRKDGTSLWIVGSAEVVVDDGGETVIQSVFLDVDARKKAELRNRKLAAQVEASNEILHMALENTTTCEFYYNPRTGECTVPERTCEIYHCRAYYGNMPQSFAMEQVDREYHPVFYEMYQRIHQGERTATCVFRGLSGQYWCRETLSVIIRDDDGSPRFVVGIVEDITQQKEMEAALEAARSKDSLTGLYKKESGLSLIQDYLEHERGPGENCALMLLDMDDFEDISQKEGEIFAEGILQEVADILRAETGEGNIQICLGRDEFMVFLKHCGREQAKVLGPRIAGLVNGILVNSEQDIKISASIGMCTIEEAEEYHTLYRSAERALDYVKGNSKGYAACFMDTSAELEALPALLQEADRPFIDPTEPENAGRGEELVSFALDLLGKAKNLNDAVYLLLSRIGRTYHFDRVSIIEADRAFLTYRFSYQWARNYTDLQLGEDFYVSDEDFEICAAMYDEDGLADHNVREGISHIASCLHAGIWNYGEYAGSMSFEINRENYRWTKEQRKLLKELVKIVPSFIMKSKADAVSQAKTDFLSRMSHEIRTPMNAISGMTTIAKTVLNDRDKAMECLEKIEASNRYLLGLINDILDMSRIESGKLELNYEAVDLAQQLESLESMFRVQAEEKHLALLFENGYREERPLLADGLRLNQVLVNIIGNAIKFTDYGGVTVLVEQLEASPRAMLRFSVTDTGIGIEPSATERIFNAFEQAGMGPAAQRGGTGLGLSISRKLVQMMGGALEVHSEVDKGSCFSFVLTFEYAAGEAETKEICDEPEPLINFQGRRVLLAEDNEINREIAQTILEMNGFEVTCAVDGREALEQFCARAAGWFDVILMDIRMPVMDGLESARRIRTSGRPDARGIPIIALTANAFDEDTKKSMESGMNGHLSKPIQIDRMLELLGKCLRPQKRDMNQSAAGNNADAPNNTITPGGTV